MQRKPNSEVEIRNNIEKEETITQPPDENLEKPKHISEVKIRLSSPVRTESTQSSDTQKLSKSETNLPETVTENKFIEFYLTKSLSDFSSCRIMKSGSDPNISHSKVDIDKEDDGLYKVPGAVRRYRYSQSLDEFHVEDVEVISSAHSSIEHISCSQSNIDKIKTEPNGTDSAQNSVSMDYCKTRSKMPQKKRKITLLRRPKHTAWINLRSKLNNVMMEQAAKQRVGAFGEKDRPGINIEEMYKNSKDKCKKMLKTTGKIFVKPRKDQENVDPNESPKIVTKRDFILAKVPKRLKASDIEHTVITNGGNNEVDGIYGGSVKSDKTDKSDKSVTFGARRFFGLSRSLEEDKKEDMDFNMIKSAFRRSKSVPEVW